MTYTVNTTSLGGFLWKVDVAVFDDAQNVLLQGETTVACETQQEAQEYAEMVFLPDLRRNFSRQIGSLVLSWEEAE